MLAGAQLPAAYLEWNRQWGAPTGYRFGPRIRFKARLIPFVARHIAGMFAFQSNSSTRAFEYPWAWDVGRVSPGMTCVDLGAGHSGFPFVLSAAGANSVLVDPFLQFDRDHNYPVAPKWVVDRMNTAFRTRVRLEHNTLDGARLADNSVDRLFCISALEHMPDTAIDSIAREAQRILKPGGLFILTVDLFLDIAPFAAPESNQFGRNIDVRRFVESTGLRLDVGTPSELRGYPDFDPAAIRTDIKKYLISQVHPVLTQCLVLRK